MPVVKKCKHTRWNGYEWANENEKDNKRIDGELHYFLGVCGDEAAISFLSSFFQLLGWYEHGQTESGQRVYGVVDPDSVGRAMYIVKSSTDAGLKTSQFYFVRERDRNDAMSPQLEMPFFVMEWIKFIKEKQTKKEYELEGLNESLKQNRN